MYNTMHSSRQLPSHLLHCQDSWILVMNAAKDPPVLPVALCSCSMAHLTIISSHIPFVLPAVATALCCIHNTSSDSATAHHTGLGARSCYTDLAPCCSTMVQLPSCMLNLCVSLSTGSAISTKLHATIRHAGFPWSLHSTSKRATVLLLLLHHSWL